LAIFAGQAIVFRGLKAMSHGPDEGPWLTGGDEKESESLLHPMWPALLTGLRDGQQ
jgi:hypothetical protein